MNNYIKVAVLERYMIFICPECGAEFNAQVNWRSHLDKVHDYLRKTPKELNFRGISQHCHECQICKQWVKHGPDDQIEVLQYHRFHHLPHSRTFRCRLCKHTPFQRKSALCEHLADTHSRQIKRMESARQLNPLDGTQRSIATPQKLLRNSEFYIRFMCPQCGKSIEYFQEWLQHLRRHKSTSSHLHLYRVPGFKNHYCLICKKMVWSDDRIKLLRHRFTHLPYKCYFQCAFCVVKRTNKMEILKHFINAHPEQFEGARKFLRKPIEWGEITNSHLSKELDNILAITNGAPANLNTVKSTNKKPQDNDRTDLIQRALLNSSIDLENETSTSDKISLSQNDFGLQQLFSTETNELKAMEFEELCNEVFQDVVVFDTPDCPTKLQAKRKAPPLISIEIDPATKGMEDKVLTVSQLPLPKRRKLSDSKGNANVVSDSDGKSERELKALLESHIIYLCPECGAEYTQQSVWRSHVFSEHDISKAIASKFEPVGDGKSICCLVCHRIQVAPKQAEMQRHYFSHMPYHSYLKCIICSKTKSSKSTMLQHIQDCHVGSLTTRGVDNSESKHKCRNCNKCLRTIMDFLEHSVQCAPPVLTRHYNIVENVKLIKHLQNARERMDKLM